MANGLLKPQNFHERACSFFTSSDVTYCSLLHSVPVPHRPVTSLEHKEGRRVFLEGPNFFKLCPISFILCPTQFSRGRWKF